MTENVSSISLVEMMIVLETIVDGSIPSWSNKSNSKVERAPCREAGKLPVDFAGH